MHETTKQKGAIEEIKAGDILILKYKTNFIGYGRAISGLETSNNLGWEPGWNWSVKVNIWIMGTHIGRYGIKEAQVSGTAYDTVKEVERNFALQKLEGKLDFLSDFIRVEKNAYLRKKLHEINGSHHNKPPSYEGQAHDPQYAVFSGTNA